MFYRPAVTISREDVFLIDQVSGEAQVSSRFLPKTSLVLLRLAPHPRQYPKSPSCHGSEQALPLSCTTTSPHPPPVSARPWWTVPLSAGILLLLLSASLPSCSISLLFCLRAEEAHPASKHQNSWGRGLQSKLNNTTGIWIDVPGSLPWRTVLRLILYSSSKVPSGLRPVGPEGTDSLTWP